MARSKTPCKPGYNSRGQRGNKDKENKKTEGKRDRGTDAHRDRGTEGQMDALNIGGMTYIERLCLQVIGLLILPHAL